MKLVEFNGIPQKGSRLVYGTGVPATWNDDREYAFETLDLAWEAGFRTFDSANRYGHAEENLGAWIEARGVRDQLVLHDKGCNPGENGSTDVLSGDSIRAFVEESLRRLRTDHLDFYLLHRDDESVPVGEVIEAFNALHEEGKVTRFGGSNWRMHRIQEANEYAKAHGLIGFTAVSPCYNIGDYVDDPFGGSIALTGSPEGEAYRKWLAEQTEYDLVISTYSALGRAFFSGKYRTDGTTPPIEECMLPQPIREYGREDNYARLARMEQFGAERGLSVAQIAIAWLINQPLYVYPIVSPTGKHIQEIVEAADVVLTQEEVNWLKNGGTVNKSVVCNTH